MRPSARPMTSSVTRAWIPAWGFRGGPGAEGSAASPRPSATSSATSSVARPAVVGAAAASRSIAARTCHTGWRSRSRKPRSARTRRSGSRAGTAAKPATAAAPKRAPQPRPVRNATARVRCTCVKASFRSSRLPAVPRRGQDHSRAVHHLQRAGKVKKQKTLEVKIPAGISEGMRIRSARQRRAGQQRRPAGRSLHRDPGQAARAVRTRRRRSALHRAGGPDHGRSRRLNRGADAGRKGRDRTAREHAARQDLPAQGKGIKGLRSSYPGDPVLPRRRDHADQAHRRTEKLLRELDESIKRGGARHSPDEKGWADRVKDLFK